MHLGSQGRELRALAQGQRERRLERGRRGRQRIDRRQAVCRREPRVRPCSTEPSERDLRLDRGLLREQQRVLAQRDRHLDLRGRARRLLANGDVGSHALELVACSRRRRAPDRELLTGVRELPVGAHHVANEGRRQPLALGAGPIVSRPRTLPIGARHVDAEPAQQRLIEGELKGRGVLLRRRALERLARRLGAELGAAISPVERDSHASADRQRLRERNAAADLIQGALLHGHARHARASRSLQGRARREQRVVQAASRQLVRLRHIQTCASGGERRVPLHRERHRVLQRERARLGARPRRQQQRRERRRARGVAPPGPAPNVPCPQHARPSARTVPDRRGEKKAASEGGSSQIRRGSSHDRARRRHRELDRGGQRS